MADTGWHSPTAFENDASWDNAANAYASDSAFANSWSNGSGTCDYTDFGFGDLSGQVVVGIEVSFEGSTKYEGDPSAETARGAMLGNGSNSGNKSFAMPAFGAEDTITEGGAADLWDGVGSSGWDGNVEDFSDANFSLRVWEDNGDVNFYLDHVQVKLYYEEAPASTSTGMMSMFV